MGLYIASIGSGSNGNCYYVGNATEAVLVDAGFSCREIERRMNRLSLSLSSVKALFISHEHSDHITGLAGLSKKYQLPVYITQATLNGCNMPIESGLLRTFQKNTSVAIGGLNVLPFLKTHDAADPHSFVISQDGVRVGVFTDIGRACPELIRQFSSCHGAFLESNYCEQMLEAGRYPYFLKRRITGGSGHLSNREALDLFVRYRSPALSHLILSHLSGNNNKPELVERLFQEHSGSTRIVVASRQCESEIYLVEAPAESPDSTGLPRSNSAYRSSALRNAGKVNHHTQLRLFES